MKTPKEKYQNDTSYRMLVDWMVSHIHQCNFTPSEMREAAMFASIIYEQTRIKPMLIHETEVDDDFHTILKKFDEALKYWINKNPYDTKGE